MEIRNASKASVYFRHGCWNHRYAKIYDNGKKEYGTISGFETNEEANKSFWEYLDKYKSKIKELKEKSELLQQSYYDEEDEDINQTIFDENLEYDEEIDDEIGDDDE